MKGKLILQPMGGLANRMRIVSVLYELCKEIGAEFEVWWVSNNDLGARWSDLFETPNFRVKDIKGSYVHAHRPGKWYKCMPHQVWAMLKGYKWLPYEDVCALAQVDIIEDSAKIRENWKKYLLAGENLFVSSGDYLGEVENLTMFRPIQDIMKKVNEFLSLINHQTSTLCGIHIRRTDNTWAIENSPLELFVNKIEGIISNDSNAVFYLATDDEETISLLKEKFGDRILVREKDFSRSTPNGIKDAVVDMWLLSKTIKIYGSYYSSFSEMASLIGNVDLAIIKKTRKNS